MGRYIITYAETYEENYEVEAGDWKEAQEKLISDIRKGIRKRPENVAIRDAKQQESC